MSQKVKAPIITIKNLVVLVFLMAVSFAVGLVGKLITNKPLAPIARAQSSQCWIPPSSGTTSEGGGTEGCSGGGEGGSS